MYIIRYLWYTQLFKKWQSFQGYHNTVRLKGIFITNTEHEHTWKCNAHLHPLWLGRQHQIECMGKQKKGRELSRWWNAWNNTQRVLFIELSISLPLTNGSLWFLSSKKQRNENNSNRIFPDIHQTTRHRVLNHCCNEICFFM